jgi:hypothetical protein
MNDEELYAEYLEGVEGSGGGSRLDSGTRAELDAIRRQLGDPATWADPPAGLGDSILAAIRAERDQRAPGEPVIEARGPSRRERERARARARDRHRGPRLLTAAAAVAVVLAAGIGLVVATTGDGDEGETFAVAGSDLAPGANGDVTIEETDSGLAITLDVEGLPPAEPGTFYQAWMKGDEGSVPIGTFHMREGDEPVELWSGVDRADYPLLTVTLQEEGAGPESSGQVFASADIAP